MKIPENQAQLTGPRWPKDLVHAWGQMCPFLFFLTKASRHLAEVTAVTDEMSYCSKMAQKVGSPFCRTRGESQLLLAGWDCGNTLMVPLLGGRTKAACHSLKRFGTSKSKREQTGQGHFCPL